MSSSFVWTPDLIPSFCTTPAAFSPVARDRLEVQTSSFDPSLPRTPRTPLTPRRKRHQQDENTPSRGRNVDHQLPLVASSEPPAKRAKYSQRRTDEEKLTHVFRALKEVDWSLGHFLYHAFRRSDDGDQSRSRTSYADKFLKGKAIHGVGEILALWMAASKKTVSDSDEAPFSLTNPYPRIKGARAALTSFAAQTMQDELEREATQAVRPTSGLHASAKPSKNQKKLVWEDIGATTTESVRKILQVHQPITLEYLTAIASGQPRLQNGVLPMRKTRPIDIVVTHALSSLDFARNREAQLLPMVEALHNVAMCASFDTFAFNSRISRSVVYTTVLRALRGLAEQEAEHVKSSGRESGKCGLLVIDNVQNYLTRREPRLGLSNQMNIGLAATFIELEDVDPAAFDLEARKKKLGESQRGSLTVTRLLQFIDQEHLHTVLTLQWLNTLVRYIPQLSHLKSQVSELYRTRASKLPLPIRPSKVHPLATTSRNETVTTELKHALVDFLEQIGQDREDYQRKLTIVCGDGLTYEKMLQLKKYLKFHPDPYQSFEILEPRLAIWHTLWTDLSRIYERHWGPSLTRDPSTLGHSATKISRKPPPSLKKVDFYPYSELAYLVLDVRMLDCWRIFFDTTDLFTHFELLAAENKLPTMDALEQMATELHTCYSTTHAIHLALDDTRDLQDDPWTTRIPEGSKWSQSESDTVVATSPSPFHGDLTLARSISFMRDTALSREAAYAVAEGDAGRVYETIKVMLFTFAGSSHSKYVTYLLETITDIELESPEGLRRASLQATLVNLTGRAGSFCALDFLQEYFNRLLQTIVQKKGMEYGDQHIRQVISRNLHHLARIKKEFREDFKLSARSAKHAHPHTRAEVKILLREYQASQLHLRRPGRYYGNNISSGISSVDDFARGMEQLSGGKLQAWIQNTTLHRTSDVSGVRTESGLHNPDAEETEDGRVDKQEITMGDMFVIDGELIIDSDLTLDSDDIDKMLL